ncbi:hypothetical protein DESUT3_31960 [Desulfuromonas versatilis]|uniref:AB hydrolase-1 domain-containing protein n=1 Tax=Desulfuromonas versatilis TaxID=2802975 RepID=A0ABN6E1T6_9BACT|nr:alpha/beta fold hydrolase [Desulfuromonas versatilis]BCR06127.1 hypothetical protein DESUT3_31960 [Desulfuromonas versatilis]
MSLREGAAAPQDRPAATISIENERRKGLAAGVTREENLPFLRTPSGSARGGVLLVHGFTASPWEMRSPAEALAQAGFLCHAVRLPGHGTTPEDLAGRSCEEWQEAVERGYRLLAEQTDRVYGVGMSTGALLLLTLAEIRPLEGVVLLSPFLRLRHRLAPGAGLLRYFLRFQKRSLPAELAPYYYELRPVNGVYQLYRLVRKVRRLLRGLRLPVLVINARGDSTIDPASGAELYRRLGSTTKEHHLLGEEVSHILTTEENPRLAETLKLISGFLDRLDRLRGPGR